MTDIATATGAVVVGLLILLVVSIDVMGARAALPRAQRIGLTLLPVWCLAMLVVYGLRLMDESIVVSTASLRMLIAAGAGVMAWALLDLHRGAK